MDGIHYLEHILDVFYTHIANYDGTDIARPYLVDNSTGTPVYTFIDVKDYHPPSNRSKRAAISLQHRLWPKGIVYYSFNSSLTSIYV